MGDKLTVPGLLNMIFENHQPSWKAEFEQWVRESRRFRSFAETYRDKIRKKLRTSQDNDALKDLYFELETANRLLNDKRFSIEYEKFGQLKRRAPDFSASFRVNVQCNIEVTRLRMPIERPGDHGDLEPVFTRKIQDALRDKLGQMPPSAVNILVIVSAWEISQSRLLTSLDAIRQSAELKQDAFFTQRGFQDTRDFLKQFQRLSAILYRVESFSEHGGVVWLNPLARHPIPSDLLNALEKL